jgi:hypothetical protein
VVLLAEDEKQLSAMLGFGIRRQGLVDRPRIDPRQEDVHERQREAGGEKRCRAPHRGVRVAQEREDRRTLELDQREQRMVSREGIGMNPRQADASAHGETEHEPVLEQRTHGMRTLSPRPQWLVGRSQHEAPVDFH